MEELQNIKWSTWEELLLSCAVHRYGNDSWDSVAIELQKRSSTTFHHHNFTAEICQQKFHDLKQQFNDRVIVDELKKLRVAELKRDVERYDLSIVSLQLKVKNLKEENSSVEPESPYHNNSVTIGVVADDKSLPANVAGKVLVEDISDRDCRSRNESTSTVLKQKDRPTELIGTEPETAGEFEKTAEESCHGSSDSVAKETEKFEEAVRVLEGSGGEGGRRENSDGQSQAELPSENDDQSPAIKSETVESQSLVELLEILRSRKLGSIFPIQHESEETTRYKSMIRQHIDLETIQSRLQKDCYSNHNSKFFRDLLLLSNNALVFYGNKSSESMAAIEFRRLISSKWASTIYHPKLDSSVLQEIPAPPLDQPIKPDPEPSASAVECEKMATSLIACGKRSSVAGKTFITSSEKKIEKQVMNVKQEEKLPVYTDKILRERRNTPKNTKTRINSTNTFKNQQPRLNEAKPNNNSSFGSKKRSASNSLGRSNEHVRRDQASLRRGYNGKQVQEQGSPAKKSGGRSLKRAVTPLPLPPVLGKRSREGGGGEVVASSSTRHGKIRSRR